MIITVYLLRVTDFSERVDVSSIHLNNLIKLLQLYVVWRKKHGQSRDFTYVDPSHNMHNSRIDLWLVSNSLNHMVNSCYIKQPPAPGHKPVILELRTYVKSLGNGYWKMKVNVLDDNNYIQSITSIIQTAMDEYENFVSKSQLWECIKSGKFMKNVI